MQSKYRARYLSGAAILALGAPAFAQSGEEVRPSAAPVRETTETEDKSIQDTIYVIGQRLALAEAQADLDRRAGGTSLVSADTFEDTRATTFTDILAYAPGVLTQTRHGEEVRLSIRGSGIQRGFQLRGIQLYQDGIPLNLADGGGEFQAIDPLSIQYVEIWRGGNALEYGSSTLGGAINFVTPTGRSASPLSIRLDGGSFGQQRGYVQVAGVNDRLDGVASVTVAEQDGWRDQSATASTRVSANAGYKFSETLEARVYLNYVDSDLELPGSLTQAQIAIDPQQAAANTVARNASNDYTLGRVGLRTTWTPSAGTEFVASTYYSERDRFHPTVFGILDQDAENTGLDLRGVFDLAQSGPVRRLIVGLSGQQYIGVEDRYTNVNGQRGVYNGRTKLDGQTLAVYGEYSHGLTDALIFQVGAQATRAERQLDNLAAPANSYDLSFDGFSPKAGLIYELNEADQLYANISRSFEPAPFGEAPIRPALPVLNAQEATTYEIGWRRRAGDVSLEATAYYSAIDNEFLALVNEAGVSLGTTNADKTVHRGIELGAAVPLTDTLDLRLSYLFSDFYFDDDAVFGDNTLGGIPPHTLNAQLSWSPAPRLTIAPMVEWRGGTMWIDHANTVGDDGYALVHLGLSGPLPGRAEWFLDVRNLTEEDYVSTTIVRDNVRGGRPLAIFPANHVLPLAVSGGGTDAEPFLFPSKAHLERSRNVFRFSCLPPLRSGVRCALCHCVRNSCDGARCIQAGERRAPHMTGVRTNRAGGP